MKKRDIALQRARTERQLIDHALLFGLEHEETKRSLERLRRLRDEGWDAIAPYLNLNPEVFPHIREQAQRVGAEYGIESGAVMAALSASESSFL